MSAWDNSAGIEASAWKNDTWVGAAEDNADVDKVCGERPDGDRSAEDSSFKCFNCGEEGHAKADCPNPPAPFSGICRICEKDGHLAKDCPDKKAVLCFNCRKEGHNTKDCKNNRVFDLSDVLDVAPEAAWEALLAADKARDLDRFRECLKVYFKAVPETTYEQLERAFRLQGFKIYIIAREKEIFVNQTLVNLQGKLDCKFEVGFFFDNKPKRAIFGKGWPKDATENLERLLDAGTVMDRGIVKCGRCNELGHASRDCPQEKVEVERVGLKCFLCGSTEHRARDCPSERFDPNLCRNCKKPGHQSTECPEPRSAEGVECKKCGETGHFARDCPTAPKMVCHNCGEEGHKSGECPIPKDPAKAVCRNCDQVGHFTTDCPQKKDWSRVKCNRCGEMGHTVKRCPMPDPDAPNADNAADIEVGGVSLNLPATEPTTATEGAWATAASQDNWATAPATSAGDTW